MSGRSGNLFCLVSGLTTTTVGFAISAMAFSQTFSSTLTPNQPPKTLGFTLILVGLALLANNQTYYRTARICAVLAVLAGIIHGVIVSAFGFDISWFAIGIVLAGIGLFLPATPRLDHLDFHAASATSAACVTSGVIGIGLSATAELPFLVGGLCLMLSGLSNAHITRLRFVPATISERNPVGLLAIKVAPSLALLLWLAETPDFGSPHILLRIPALIGLAMALGYLTSPQPAPKMVEKSPRLEPLATVNSTVKRPSGTKLIQTENEFREAIADAPFPVMIHTTAGNVLLVNHRWTQLSGYRLQDIPTFTDWTEKAFDSNVVSDDTNKHPQADDALTNEQIFTIHTKAGDTRRWSIKSQVLSNHGKKSARIISVAVDITETFQTQRELDQFFNLSIEMLCIISSDGYLKRINPSFTEIFGYNKEELLRHRLVELVHADDRTSTQRLLNRLADGEPTINFENRVLTRHGDYRWLVWSAFPDPETNLIYAAARDVTEEKHANEETKRATIALEKSNHELATFANFASHDLREPLRTIASFTDLLESTYGDQLDDEGRKYLHFISTGAKRSQALIKAVLDYSRLGTKGATFETCDCNVIIEEVTNTLSLFISETNTRVDTGPLPSLVADPIQLAQVFQNLIKNAIRFRQSGRDPLVSILAFELADEWQFTVKDNGIGIEQKYFEKIFALFQRLDNGETEGTGLGLGICKRIIDRHHGRLWLESTIGEGSSFHFTIPKHLATHSN